MLKIAICDDEAAEVKRIEGFVRTYDDCDICAYTNSKKLAWDIEDGASFDLYLLDVVMPSPDGIELARLIRDFDVTAVIIYLTSRTDRSLDAFRVHASQYLVKPVSFDMLRKELDTALITVKNRNAKTFLLKTKDSTAAIPFHRIVYCEHKDRTLCCITADGETHLSTTLRIPFNDAISPLLSDCRFIRPHTSFVVNMDYVQRIQGSAMLIGIHGSVPIAHRAIGEIKERYLQYFFRGEET